MYINCSTSKKIKMEVKFTVVAHLSFPSSFKPSSKVKLIAKNINNREVLIYVSGNCQLYEKHSNTS